MKKIKGIFFDLGGSLRVCEEAPAHQEKARNRLAELAGWPDAQALIELVEDRYASYQDWALAKNKEAGDFELWDKWLLPELDKEHLAAVCHELTCQYRQAKGLWRVVPGGLKVIRRLYERGYRLGILSNLIGENEISDWLREDGLAQYFDAVVLSSVCHVRKPDPRIYHIGCEALGLEPEECASVTGSLGWDAAGARAAGLGANILFISPEELAKKTIAEEKQPDYIVHQFPEILELPILQ